MIRLTRRSLSGLILALAAAGPALALDGASFTDATGRTGRTQPTIACGFSA